MSFECASWRHAVLSICLLQVSELSSVASVLPGILVNALITAVLPAGLNVQVLGYFEGTLDHYHLGLGDVVGRFKLGDKVRDSYK